MHDGPFEWPLEMTGAQAFRRHWALLQKSVGKARIPQPIFDSRPLLLNSAFHGIRQDLSAINHCHS